MCTLSAYHQGESGAHLPSVFCSVPGRLLMVCTGLADNAQQSVEGQRRSASVEQAGGLFSSIIGETSVTHRWVVREGVGAFTQSCSCYSCITLVDLVLFRPCSAKTGSLYNSQE